MNSFFGQIENSRFFHPDRAKVLMRYTDLIDREISGVVLIGLAFLHIEKRLIAKLQPTSARYGYRLRVGAEQVKDQNAILRVVQVHPIIVFYDLRWFQGESKQLIQSA